MKFAVLLALALTVVACNKSETPAPEVGHDKEHQHVEAGADHAHEEGHHQEHDHQAHHPEHGTEQAPQQ